MIRIPDYPMFVDSFSYYTGLPARSASFASMADACNWLNYYARRVFPYTRLGPGTIEGYYFVYPVDTPTTTGTRRLTVVFGVRDTEGDYIKAVKVSSTTDPTGETVFVNAYGSPGSRTVLHSSEYGISYYVASVAITPGTKEKIFVDSVSAGTGAVGLDGVGAWELPTGTYDLTVNGGVAPGACEVAKTEPYVVNPTSFYPGVNLTTGAVQSLTNAVEESSGVNGKILFCSGHGDADEPTATAQMCWYLGSTTANTYVRFPVGGIYLPPVRALSGQNYVNIRATAYVRNDNASANYTVRMYSESLSATYTETESPKDMGWAGLTNPGTPWAYNSALSGISGRMNADGDWVSFDLKQDATDCNARIEQVVIWDDGL